MAVNIRLLMAVLAAACVDSAHTADAALPRVSPDRLQFFEYESVSVSCDSDGSADWSVKRTLREILPTNISNWETSAGSGTIKPAFSSDTGQYWCEDGDGLRSHVVTITVTAGSVILESPVLPVSEGDQVTLHCQKKKSPPDLIADFYKDGLHIKTGYKGNMIIYNVSTSDEGIYKCDIPGAGQSPESLLAVRVCSDPHEETRPPNSHSPDLFTLWIVVTIVLLAPLLLGVQHYTRHQEPQASGANTKARLREESLLYSSVYYTVMQKADHASS